MLYTFQKYFHVNYLCVARRPQSQAVPVIRWMFSVENGLQHWATDFFGLHECVGARGNCSPFPQKEVKEPRLKNFHP